MVPHNSPPAPDAPRELSPETVQRLREVIAERWRARDESREWLITSCLEAYYDGKD